MSEGNGPKERWTPPPGWKPPSRSGETEETKEESKFPLPPGSKPNIQPLPDDSQRRDWRPSRPEPPEEPAEVHPDDPIPSVPPVGAEPDVPIDRPTQAFSPSDLPQKSDAPIKEPVIPSVPPVTPRGPIPGSIPKVEQSAATTRASYRSATQAPSSETSPPSRPIGEVSRLRRGRLAIRKLDPISVFRFSMVFYFCLMLVMLLAAGLVYGALRTVGVVSNLEQLVAELIRSDFKVEGFRLFLIAFLGGAVWTVVASLVTTFASFLYNLIADVVGGIEMIVVERDR